MFRIFEFQITEFSNEDNKMPEMREDENEEDKLKTIKECRVCTR